MLEQVLITAATCFGTMGIGVAVSRSGLLSEAARKGVATLYAKLVFPMMVFKGVAAIKMDSIEPSVVLVALAAKLIVAIACISFVSFTLARQHGMQAIAHAAMLAMSASHSFDVTWGLPLAKLLYPSQAPYIYLNQSVQLVLVNPLLLILVELPASTGSGGVLSKVRAQRD